MFFLPTAKNLSLHGQSPGVRVQTAGTYTTNLLTTWEEKRIRALATSGPQTCHARPTVFVLFAVRVVVSWFLKLSPSIDLPFCHYRGIYSGNDGPGTFFLHRTPNLRPGSSQDGTLSKHQKIWDSAFDPGVMRIGPLYELDRVRDVDIMLVGLLADGSCSSGHAFQQARICLTLHQEIGWRPVSSRKDRLMAGGHLSELI